MWVLKRGSFEYTKHMFKLMGKEINAILCAKISLSGSMLNWTYVKYHELNHIHFLYRRQYHLRILYDSFLVQYLLRCFFV